MTTNGLNGKTGELLRWLSMLVLGTLVSYFTAQAAITNRITVLETLSSERWEYVKAFLQQNKEQLNRIEDKQQQSDDEFRGILRDWLNGVDRRTGEPLPLQRSLRR